MLQHRDESKQIYMIDSGKLLRSLLISLQEQDRLLPAGSYLRSTIDSTLIDMGGIKGAIRSIEQLGIELPWKVSLIGDEYVYG